jgi:hypothetical protein
MANISAEVKVSIQTQVFLQNLKDVPKEVIREGFEEVAPETEKRVKGSITTNGFVKSRELLKSVNSNVQENSLAVGAIPFYAAILERGARPHKIKAKQKRLLSWTGIQHPIKEVNHPGFRGKKFLEKPINEMVKQGEIESIFSKVIQRALKKAGG